MSTKIFRRAIWITSSFHIVVIAVGTFAFIADKEEYGNDYWGHVVWSDYMFLIFIPITYAIVFFILLTFHLLTQKGNN